MFNMLSEKYKKTRTFQSRPPRSSILFCYSPVITSDDSFQVLIRHQFDSLLLNIPLRSFSALH